MALSIARALGTLLTHVALVPALYWTWRRRRKFWLEFAIFASIFFWSFLYHLCYDAGVCLLPHAHHLRTLDYFFAQLAFPIGALFLCCVDIPCIKGLYTALILHVNFLLLYFFGPIFVNNIILLGTALAVIVAHYLVHRFVWRIDAWPPFDGIDAFVGVWFSLLGVLLFFIDSNRGYALAHSAWHAFSFSGAYFLFEARCIDRTLCVRRDTWRRWARHVWPFDQT